MALFFHAGFPFEIFLFSLFLIILCTLLTIRGFYLLLTKTPNKTIIHLGIVFGVFLIIWLTFLLTDSSILQTICICFGFPFGRFAGMPLFLFANPPESIIYLGSTLLNLVALYGVIEFVKRIITRKRLS